MDGQWGRAPVGVGRLGCTAVGAALLATLATCSYTDEGDQPEAPLIIEPAPTEAGPPLDLDIPLDPSGLFVFSQWPSACDLLTDNEITTVLPQATVTGRQANAQEFRFVETLETVTVANSECNYLLDIPEAGLDVEGATMISVSVEAAGSPDAVELNVGSDPGDPRIEVPSGECRGEAGAAVECHKGPLAFRVTSIFDIQQYGDQWTNRYEVGGETTTFSGEYGDEGTAAVAEDAEFLRDALSAELAKIILAKI